MRPGGTGSWLSRECGSAGRLPTNTKSWVRAARPVLTGNDGSVRYGGPTAFGGPRTSPPLGSRREGGGVSVFSRLAAPGFAPAIRPDRVLPVSGSGWQGLPPHQSGVRAL